MYGQVRKYYSYCARWRFERGGWDSRFAGSNAPAALRESNRVLILNPLGKNAKGPERGLSHFGGEGERTLEELVSSIRRTLDANKPEAALDHLHTYCVKKFTHLLSVRGIECAEDEPLHSRFGKYRKALIKERDRHEFTGRTLKVAISLFESYNDLRNNRSMAHDNELLRTAGAIFWQVATHKHRQG